MVILLSFSKSVKKIESKIIKRSMMLRSGSNLVMLLEKSSTTSNTRQLAYIVYHKKTVLWDKLYQAKENKVLTISEENSFNKATAYNDKVKNHPIVAEPNGEKLKVVGNVSHSPELPNYKELGTPKGIPVNGDQFFHAGPIESLDAELYNKGQIIAPDGSITEDLIKKAIEK